MKIGVISDTHGLLRPEVVERLRAADQIIHAGDVGSLEVLQALESLAPLTVVRGNNDRAWWARRLPETALVELEGACVYVLHDRNELDLDPHSAGIAAVISGHSHKPAIATEHGVLFINPGSVGPRRFGLPLSMAWLTLSHGGLASELVVLDPTAPA